MSAKKYRWCCGVVEFVDRNIVGVVVWWILKTEMSLMVHIGVISPDITRYIAIYRVISADIGGNIGVKYC